MSEYDKFPPIEPARTGSTEDEYIFPGDPATQIPYFGLLRLSEETSVHPVAIRSKILSGELPARSAQVIGQDGFALVSTIEQVEFVFKEN